MNRRTVKKYSRMAKDRPNAIKAVHFQYLARSWKKTFKMMTPYQKTAVSSMFGVIGLAQAIAKSFSPAKRTKGNMIDAIMNEFQRTVMPTPAVAGTPLRTREEYIVINGEKFDMNMNPYFGDENVTDAVIDEIKLID